MKFRRTFATVIALGAFSTIAIRIWLRMDADGESLGEAVWSMYRYYTIWTTTLIGIACACVALSRGVKAQTLTGLLLSIIIVAVVYHALLARLNDFVGIDAFIDTMLHTVIPIAFAAFWIVFVPKAGLRNGHILEWLVLPFVYCIYAMIRAQFDGEYPYFFLNLTELGITRTALNILGLLIAFAVIGALIVWVAHWIDRIASRVEGHKA